MTVEVRRPVSATDRDVCSSCNRRTSFVICLDNEHSGRSIIRLCAACAETLVHRYKDVRQKLRTAPPLPDIDRSVPEGGGSPNRHAR